MVYAFVEEASMVIVGKKSFKGPKRSGPASSFSPWQTGEEASCCHTEVYAGSGSCTS